MTMADAARVHTVEEKRAVAVRPKPAFQPLLEIARIRAGSGIVLVSQEPPDEGSQMAETTKEPPPGGHEAYADWFSWWRRGRERCLLFAKHAASENPLFLEASELGLGRGNRGGLEFTLPLDWAGSGVITGIGLIRQPRGT